MLQEKWVTDENLPDYRVGALSTDAAGNLYLLDTENKRVLVRKAG